MPCLYHLDEEYVQDFLEPNLGRRLTPKEIYRMKYALIDNDQIDGARMDMMYLAGKDAIDNSEGQWDEIDEDFEKDIPFFMDLECKEK